MSGRRSLRARLASLAAFAAICLAMFAYLYRAGGGDVPGQDTYAIQVVLPTAVALVPDAEVRMGGVEVGKVQEISGRAGNAVVLAEIDADHAPIYRDAAASVRLKTVVGENYLALDPGSPEAGEVPENGVLPLENADPSTQLDEILSALDSPTRRELRRLLSELGTGLRSRGDDLNRLFGATAAVVDESGPVARLLASERRATAKLVDDLGVIMRAFGDRARAIRVLAPQAKAAAEAVAARDEFLAQAIEELPGMLDQAGRTSTRLGSLTPVALPVLRDLTAGFEELAPVMAQLRPAAAEGKRTMSALAAFGPRAEGLLAALAGFSGRTGDALPKADALLAELNPLIEYVGPRSRELGAFFASLRSGTTSVDATGHVARVHVMLGESTFAAATPEQERALDALFSAGAIERFRSRHNNPYPEPGTIGAPAAFDSEYPHLEPLPRLIAE